MARKPDRSPKKKLLITSCAVLVLFLGFALLAKAMGWIGGERQGTEVETAIAERRTITQLVTASGRIQPEIEVKLAPDVSGEIIELSVKEGDFVGEGDLLLRIRPDLIQARIDELNANLMNQKARREQSRASMLQSENAFDKQRQLYEKEMIPELEYMNALRNLEAEQANFQASEFMVQNAEAQMRRAEEELRQTVIRAPMSGTISMLNVERGERVVGSVQMAGTELLRIARMEQMEVQIDVNENDIVHVRQNNVARINVDAYPNEYFEGSVTEIANSPHIRGEGTTEQITEYPVKIRIHSRHNINDRGDTALTLSGNDIEVRSDAGGPQFKPGMTATVDIETNTVENALSVPIQAVTVREVNADTDEENPAPVRSDSLQRVIFLVRDGEAQMNTVETGISDDTYIYIKSGVEPGDEVITGNYRVLTRVLTDGDPVEVNNAFAPAMANR
ncbi:MAG: efflux RND transporter periplasmic adaptor subunit [Balneolales bacterium]